MYSHGGGGTPGDLALSCILSLGHKAHLPCQGIAAPSPPILFDLIWSRVGGGPEIDIEEEARQSWADPAGVGLFFVSFSGYICCWRMVEHLANVRAWHVDMRTIQLSQNLPYRRSTAYFHRVEGINLCVTCHRADELGFSSSFYL